MSLQLKISIINLGPRIQILQSQLRVTTFCHTVGSPNLWQFLKFLFWLTERIPLHLLVPLLNLWCQFGETKCRRDRNRRTGIRYFAELRLCERRNAYDILVLHELRLRTCFPVYFIIVHNKLVPSKVNNVTILTKYWIFWKRFHQTPTLVIGFQQRIKKNMKIFQIKPSPANFTQRLEHDFLTKTYDMFDRSSFFEISPNLFIFYCFYITL